MSSSRNQKSPDFAQTSLVKVSLAALIVFVVSMILALATGASAQTLSGTLRVTVTDSTGALIPDAKVTAEIKGRGSVITRSNATGAYKLPGFGKEISPNNVIISCSKDGYKQTRSFTRTPLNKKPLAAIEIQCSMQRVSTK